jgi:hypothetical protein
MREKGKHHVQTLAAERFFGGLKTEDAMRRIAGHNGNGLEARG